MNTPTQPQAHVEIPNLSDFVVLKKSDVQALVDAIRDLWDSASTEGCETPYFVGDSTHMDKLVLLKPALQSARSMDAALRLVNGDACHGGEPVLLVLPPGLDNDAAIQKMNAAIDEANDKTRCGEDGGYFEALQGELARSGIAMQQDIEKLHSRPWDADSFGGPALDDDSGEYLLVEFLSSPDDFDQIEPVGHLIVNGELDVSTQVEPIEDVQFKGFCTRLEVTYPRGARYSIPAMATDSGGAEFIRENTNLKVHSDFEVVANDSRDDTAQTFVVHALVHKDCVRVVENDQAQSRPLDR